MDTVVTDPVVGLLLEGRYRLEERLARGGMSTVYAATDLRLDRTVAVKVMAEHLAHDPAFVDRFTREARATAMLSHVNVVSVSDQGSDQGLVFLVMELVRGRTLRDLLQARGRLTVGEAFAVLEPVLAGLTAAHRAGIAHRDVKPENVLISTDGQVKVADFGLARAVAGTGQTSHTGGVLIGTVAYLSPEQLERGRSDARSDVYAAGIMFYELLTGHPPYAGDSALAVAYQHVHHDVPAPSSEAPGVPWQVDELVARTTRRDPAARPLDAGAFLAELTDLRADLGLARVPVPTGRPADNPTQTLRPTNRPTAPRPRHPSAPGGAPRTEVLGGRVDRARGTTVLPGTGAGPTTAVGSARPGLPPRGPAARPGVPPHIRRRRARFALALVLLLAITIGAIGWWLGSGRWTDVPDLVGQDKDTAIGMLQEAGLDPAFGEEQFSETVAEGEVISADPAGGGEAIRGTDVEIVVSRGPERFTVSAEFTGQPADDVQAQLQQQFPQLTFQQTQETSEDVGAGNVIRFDPPAGTQLQAGASVTLVVSSGRAPVKVPNVVGQAPDAAQDTLEQLGFVVQRDTGRSAEVGTGQVMTVSPGPGDAQPYGSTVTITVSEGVPQVTVPDVVGKSEKDATAALKAVGLKASSTSFIAGDRVFQQSPKAGETVDQGSTVRILISFG
ncbi:Two-component serine/threonine-protein kinase PK-1 [Modestobacter italicus]|uniref:non-specific serine/threonine protein kinase n=1 Tax=Modestobacter italicus (strain DSM 44449 / CECT 9708 / BC 501) TaxID=2732864 RepID=I4EZV4_MODI5|nr:Stk1 family PASTA domain-containing Ser/Thr kinase [Modestobacter marinus]CCH88917.1 Two-component serine/threonine-protein kinase PK-1 [Modestobacter marinus]